MDPTKRLILAAVIAFGFFAVYDFFFIESRTPPPSTTQEEKATPDAQPASPAAPIARDEPSVSEVSGSPDPQVGTTLAESGRAAVTVQTAISTIEIDDLGRIQQVYLSDAIFTGADLQQLSLLDPSQPRPLEVRFTDRSLNDLAFNTPHSVSATELDARQAPQQLQMVQELGGTTLTRTFTFYPEGNYDLHLQLSQPAEYFITNGYRPIAETDPMTVQGSLIHQYSGSVETIREGKAKGTEAFRQAGMVSSFDRYYATLLYNYDDYFDVYVNRILGSDPLPFVRGLPQMELGGYIGPKYYTTLQAIHPELTAAIEYGFFTFLSKPLFWTLDWIHGYVPNWGWSIVLFTILVKILLFPLAHKGMIGMAKLKDIAPKMKELQAKYKDDKQKLQVHMMELYKKHGANPLGGCLPLLLQIPIFFAVYRVLINAIELKGASWFYVADLSATDPYFILPVLMGATMYLQQRLTPTTFTDPMQEKIFRWLPIIFTFFFIFFPAGLVLYWLVNNLVSIVHQYWINKRLEAAKAAAIRAAHHEKD